MWWAGRTSHWYRSAVSLHIVNWSSLCWWRGLQERLNKVLDEQLAGSSSCWKTLITRCWRWKKDAVGTAYAVSVQGHQPGSRIGYHTRDVWHAHDWCCYSIQSNSPETAWQRMASPNFCKFPPFPRPASSLQATSSLQARDPGDDLYEGYNDYDPQLHQLYTGPQSQVLFLLHILRLYWP